MATKVMTGLTGCTGPTMHDVGNSLRFNGDSRKALASIPAKIFIALPMIDFYIPLEEGVWAAQHIKCCELLRLPFGGGHLVASVAEPQAAALLNETVPPSCAKFRGSQANPQLSCLHYQWNAAGHTIGPPA